MEQNKVHEKIYICNGYSVYDKGFYLKPLGDKNGYFNKQHWNWIAI